MAGLSPNIRMVHGSGVKVEAQGLRAYPIYTDTGDIRNMERNIHDLFGASSASLTEQSASPFGYCVY